MRTAVSAFLLLLSLPLVAAAQTLTLAKAVEIALEKNPTRKVALADTRIAEAGVAETRALWFPQVMFSETATRGNDPVYVFGTKLRQQRFATSDFALNRLNTPTPLGNFTSKFSGQWRIFNSLQTYRTVKRAKLMSEAASKQLERADQELIARVVQAYYGLLLARKQLTVAEDSLKTAQSIEERSGTRVGAGVAVGADLLSAQVLSASRKQELIRARNALSLAQSQLSLVMGLGSDATSELVDVSADAQFPDSAPGDLERTALEHRPDLLRIRKEESAQQQAVAAARSNFGPRLDVIGSWQTDSPSLGWNGGNNWMGGVELQLDLFTGGAKMARVKHERATAERVAALRTAAEDSVRLEVRRAYYDFDASRQQVEVAKAAVSQAEESLRILRNRYESGLSTVTDLLRVEEAAHGAQTGYWDAVYRVRMSYMNLEFATGTLSANSQAVTQ